jgi:hypothetical protein
MSEARIHYSRGVQLYTDGSYDAALVELERANKLAPSYRILYSIGLVQLKLSDFVGAKSSFERYLADGGAEVPPARKTEVEERLAQITDRIATLDVKVNVADADVLVDDISVGRSPLGHPVLLNPGYHKISSSKAGYTPDARQQGFAGGDKTTIEITLQQIAAPVAPSQPQPVTPTQPVPEQPAPQPPPPEAKTPTGVWVGWAVTGALVAGGVVTGIVALSDSSKVTTQIDNQATAQSDIQSTHSKTVTMAAVTDVLLGAAVVAGGVTLYFTLKKPHPTTAAMHSPATQTPAGTAQLHVGPRSVGLGITF